MNPNETWWSLARRRASQRYEVKVNLLNLRDKWIKWKREKRDGKYEWIYNCGCKAVSYRSAPYCPIHGLKLVHKKIRPMTEAEFYEAINKED